MFSIRAAQATRPLCSPATACIRSTIFPDRSPKLAAISPIEGGIISPEASPSTSLSRAACRAIIPVRDSSMGWSAPLASTAPPSRAGIMRDQLANRMMCWRVPLSVIP